MTNGFTLKAPALRGATTRAETETDRRTDGQTDRQTERQADIIRENIYFNSESHQERERERDAKECHSTRCKAVLVISTSFNVVHTVQLEESGSIFNSFCETLMEAIQNKGRTWCTKPHNQRTELHSA